MVTLGDVAARQVRLLGAVSLPLHVFGAIASHGAARWLFVTVGLVGVMNYLHRRPLNRLESGLAVAIPTGLVPLWAWLAPGLPFVNTALVAVMIMLFALMSARPFAEIGIGALPAVFAVTQMVFAPGGHLVLQTIGVALAYGVLGVVLLSIRVVTERTMTARDRALGAMNEQLERLNRTDPLTGLANRRHLDEVLSDTWADGARTGRPVGVIMIDIDHFKLYNDHYGHPGGDACLRKVGTAIASAVRTTDIVARYGGEEFAIILADADADTVRRVAETVRLTVALLEEEHAVAPSGSVSVSVGVASGLPGDGGTPHHLLQRADDGLYEAKRNGRDRVGAV